MTWPFAVVARTARSSAVRRGGIRGGSNSSRRGSAPKVRLKDESSGARIRPTTSWNDAPDTDTVACLQESRSPGKSVLVGSLKWAYIVVMPDPIYLDHAATTPVRPEVFEAMAPFYGPKFGNPSSTHRWGREARAALDEARERVANALGARPDEVCFTSGGTEGDNLAILGGWRAVRGNGRNAIVSTPIEHKAVLGAVHQASKEGAEERLCRVKPTGVVDIASFEELTGQDVAVVSVMWV